MQASLLRDLRCHEPALRARWDALLHAEPVTSPLALPDVLAHLIDSTLEEVFSALASSCPNAPPSGLSDSPPSCPCGRNPYLAYFSAGARALREGLVTAQTTSPCLDARARDSALAELTAVFSGISRREIETFCSVCQHRVRTR